MDERRQTLGMTWADVARQAEITVETLRAIRRGNNEPSSLTKRGLDRALSWRPGGTQAVLQGEHPSEVDPVTGAETSVPPNAPDAGDEPLTGTAYVEDHFARLIKLSKEVEAEKIAEQNRLLEEQNRLLEERNRLLEEARRLEENGGNRRGA